MGDRDAVRRFAGLEELSRAAAEELCRIAAEAVAARGRFTVALSGGNTPGPLYAFLAAEPYRGRVDWGRAEVFWSDERAVGPDQQGSNFRLAEELLKPLALPAERLHRIQAEAGPERAAVEYERELARSFGMEVGGPPPAFDLLILGMGPDGHVASLFPNGAALDERRRWAVASRAPGVYPDRVTLTPPVLAAARQVLVLVAGAAKAETLAKVIEGPRDPRRLPAQLLLAAGDRVTWFADDAAAALLAADAGAAQAGGGSLLLAGDAGGTKTALAIFAREGDRLTLLRQREYPSRDHASLEEIVRLFLEERSARIDDACFAVAGPVARGESRTTNLPWTVEARRLARLVGTERVKLVNDLAAAAFGMLFLAPGDFRALRAAEPGPGGNMAVIAPGTGLGEAVLFWDGARHQPMATEGGHADFAPRTDEQLDLWRYLRARFGEHVSYERVLSGDGLHNLYSFLRDGGKRAEPPWVAERLAHGDRNATIAELALAGESALCVAALDLFCSILGAEAGNLALKSFATGGVILGGGIPPKILPALEKGGFLAALTDKGRLTSWLEDVPVKVALDPRASVIGAAHLC